MYIPGLSLRGSIMGIPISDFIKMRKMSVDKDIVEVEYKRCCKKFDNYVDELGTVKKYDEKIRNDYLDAIYNDQMGKKIGISIASILIRARTLIKLLKALKRTSVVDKLVILDY